MTARSNDARPRGRELALLALCHLESYDAQEARSSLRLLWDNPPGGSESALGELVRDPAVRAFAERLLDASLRQRESLDAAIEATSRAWRLERMDRVDRNLVRLAGAELSGDFKTPRPVIVSEAVRLAGIYGGERSVRFVNGLVEALANSLVPPPASKAAADD